MSTTLTTDHRPLTVDPPPDPVFMQHLQFPLYAGDLTLVIGSPGVGKSLLAFDLAARVALGAPFPPAANSVRFGDLAIPHFAGDPYSPGDVVYLSTEGRDHHDTAEAFGIPPARFHTRSYSEELTIIARRTSLFEKRTLASDASIPLLDWLNRLNLPKLRLLILDPLPPFLGPISAHSTTIRDRP